MRIMQKYIKEDLKYKWMIQLTKKIKLCKDPRISNTNNKKALSIQMVEPILQLRKLRIRKISESN